MQFNLFDLTYLILPFYPNTGKQILNWIDGDRDQILQSGILHLDLHRPLAHPPPLLNRISDYLVDSYIHKYQTSSASPIRTSPTVVKYLNRIRVGASQSPETKSVE